MILTEICAELRNWFVVPYGVHIQTYTISGGSIAPPPLLFFFFLFSCTLRLFHDFFNQRNALQILIA